MARSPEALLSVISSPASVSKTGWIPKKGSVADPGLVGVAPGNGEIIIPPVSVCHHVSTIGHCLSPIKL